MDYDVFDRLVDVEFATFFLGDLASTLSIRASYTVAGHTAAGLDAYKKTVLASERNEEAPAVYRATIAPHSADS